IVAVVGCLIGKFHREAEGEVVLGRHLPQLLEFFHPRDGLQRRPGIAKEGLFLQRAASVFEREDHRVPDHALAPSQVTASLAVIAVILTTPRLVVEGARICAGACVPMRMGPTASALSISLSSVIDRLALSRFGKSSRLASPLSRVSGM